MRTRRYMHGRRRKKSALTAVAMEEQGNQQEQATQDWERAKTNNSKTAKETVASEGKEGIQKVEIVNNNNQMRPTRGRAIRGAFASIFGR